MTPLGKQLNYLSAKYEFGAMYSSSSNQFPYRILLSVAGKLQTVTQSLATDGILHTLWSHTAWVHRTGLHTTLIVGWCLSFPVCEIMIATSFVVRRI